jgi:MFS family permease
MLCRLRARLRGGLQQQNRTVTTPTPAAAPAAPPTASPTPRPRRIYYGWVQVMALGISAAFSYGILTYSFPVFLVPMMDELGWSRAAITGAFSLALLVSGVAAPLVGRMLDVHGARGVMTGGTILAGLALVGWSRVSSLVAFYLVAVALGAAMAAVLYQPAFAVIARWFVRARGRALTLLTFIGGFASIIFVPLAAVLVESLGWRGALLVLAALLVVVTLPLHALLLRRDPEDLGLLPDGADAAAATPPAGPLLRSVDARDALRSPSFRRLALAFGLAAVVSTGIAVHLIPLLLERGSTPAFAAGAMGMVGLMALPGRLIFTPLGDRLPRGAITAAIFTLAAAGTAVLLLTRSSTGVWLFVILFGAGFGAITPARAALVAELYGPASYGRISGVLALLVAFANAAAPIGLSLLHAITGGYDLVLGILAGMSLIAALAVLPHRAPAIDASSSIDVISPP